MENKDWINYYLEQLYDTQIVKISRCANMVLVLFEDTLSRCLSLHIQCTCRFCDNNSILLSNGDIYTPAKDDVDYNEFDWTKSTDTLFDEFSNKFLFENKLIVQATSMNQYNDLFIQFYNGMQFSVYCNASSSDELWRLFDNDVQHPHVVASGKTLSIE